MDSVTVKEIALAGLGEAVESAKNNSKFPIFLDSTGNVATFLQYQNCALKEAFKAPVKVAMGQQSKDEIMEEWRAQIIMSMRHEGFVCF